MERIEPTSTASGSVGMTAANDDNGLNIGGTYHAVCRNAAGEILWEDDIVNLVTDVGKKLLLDTLIAGSAYTVVGPYMGLTGSSPTPAAADTMASHVGWTEVGGTNGPAYSGNRLTITFSAASGTGTVSKASTGTYTFTFSAAGTVGGCFLVLGTGALNTKDNTAGTLYSVGAFGTGNKSISGSGDTVTVTYTAQA